MANKKIGLRKASKLSKNKKHTSYYIDIATNVDNFGDYIFQELDVRTIDFIRAYGTYSYIWTFNKGCIKCLEPITELDNKIISLKQMLPDIRDMFTYGYLVEEPKPMALVQHIRRIIGMNVNAETTKKTGKLAEIVSKKQFHAYRPSHNVYYL